MNKKRSGFITVLLFYIAVATAQVQVSKEPRHKNVLENKYIRLLNVWLQPGDTTLFHIHSTPSVFLHFTNTVVCSQINGKEWVTAKNTQGNAWYRSFVNDTLVHRVSNCDTVPFHVTDVEIISSYDTLNKKNPLPFTLLFENKKVFAYRLAENSFATGIISNRGPMIAELVSGDEVYYVDAVTGMKKEIKAGGFLYMEPGIAFHLSFTGKGKVNMVLFEIK
jgi:hypothetical protein